MKKIRKIEIKSKWHSNRIYSGSYTSPLKGAGMKFKEVREYYAGDDTRFIDWNVSARTGHLYSKIFEEDREIPVYILADLSNSTLFGSNEESKKQLITQLCADLSYSAISNNDKTGFLLFSNTLKKYIPPEKKLDSVEYMVKYMIRYNSIEDKTDLAKPLVFLNSVSRQRSIVFIISDFICDNNYANILGITSQKHDVIGIQVYDKIDYELPNLGWLQAKDLETGKKIIFNTSSKKNRDFYTKSFFEKLNITKSIFTKINCDFLQLETGENYTSKLHQFFLYRSK